MVSLSFGYHRPAIPDTVWDEIDTCLKANIIVFAAASNDAGNKPRTYPGEYNGVLCIHSATGEGNASIFNPSPLDEPDGNFSFVGEELNSHRALGTGDFPLQDLTQRRSGTSFATPVAVAMAAFMIGYIRRKIKDHYWAIKPLSPLGIQKIFSAMSHKRDNYNWIDPEWYFLKFTQEKIKEDLKHLLRASAVPRLEYSTEAN